MESERIINERLVELIQRAERARDEKIISNAVAFAGSALFADDAIQWPRLIGDEAAKLYDRMHFLVKHPKLPQFLGGSAIKMAHSKYPNHYNTGPLLRTEAEHKGDLSMSSYIEISSFITPKIYRTSAYGENEHMTITRVTQDMDSGEKLQTDICDFYVHAWNGKASKNQTVSLRGGDFEEFRRNKEKEQFEKLEKEHPELAEDFNVFKGRSLVGELPSVDDYYAIENIHALIETNKTNEKEDFPNEMYHLPLGILIQANRALRRK